MNDESATLNEISSTTRPITSPRSGSIQEQCKGSESQCMIRKIGVPAAVERRVRDRERLTFHSCGYVHGELDHSS